MTYLLVPLETGQIQPILLQRPVLLIGRHPECDVRIDSAKISRRHCCLAMAYDRVLIRDLGSRNGVRVNGRAVDEARLYVGDEVAIGPLIYKVRAESAPGAAPSPEAARKPQPAQAPGPVPGRPVSASSDDADLDLVPIDDL